MTTVVIGAGLAGTFAARQLHENGEDVVILEATAFLGGRTRGDRDLLYGGAVADLGASWLDIGQDLLLQFCVDQNLALTPRATPFPKGPGSHYSGASVMLANMIMDNTRIESVERQALAEEVQTAIEGQPPTPVETLTAWSNRVGLSPRAHEAYVMQGAFNPTMRRDIVSTSHVHPGSIMHICWLLADGTDTMARTAAEGLDIRYSTPVRLITRRGNRYSVETDNGNFDADNVVVTSSIQATRSIGFDPVLPEWKTRALLSMPMSQGAKLVAQYRNAALINAKMGPSTSANGPASMYWLKPGPEDTVIVLATMTDLGDGAIVNVEATLELVDRDVELMTGVAPERLAGTIQDWTSEEFVGGVVSLGTGGHNARAALGAPVDGIHFAGEATGEWTTAMEGAARSGLRVADEILQKRRRGGLSLPKTFMGTALAN